MKEIKLNESVAKMLGINRNEGYLSYSQMIEYYNVQLTLCNDIVTLEGFDEELCAAVYEFVNRKVEELEEAIKNTTDEDTIRIYQDDRDEMESDPYSILNEEFICQYYIMNASDYAIEMLKEEGEIIAHNEQLGLDILCVTHWGTSWDWIDSNIKYVVESEEK